MNLCTKILNELKNKTTSLERTSKSIVGSWDHDIKENELIGFKRAVRIVEKNIKKYKKEME